MPPTVLEKSWGYKCANWLTEFWEQHHEIPESFLPQLAMESLVSTDKEIKARPPLTTMTYRRNARAYRR